MTLAGAIGRIALALAASALCSCGIRIPVRPVPVIPVHMPARPSKPVPPPDPDVLVWLLADNLHTAMVFPYDWLLESGFVPPPGIARPRYVTLSWGNREAYVERRWLSPWKAARALFTPSPSVMEVIPIDWDVAEVVPHQRIYRKLVPRSHGPELAAFLNACGKRDSAGRPLVIGDSSWGEGVLVDSPYHYFLPRICNIWTVQAIEACGGKLNAWLSITANGLIREAERPPNDFEKIWSGRLGDSTE